MAYYSDLAHELLAGVEGTVESLALEHLEKNVGKADMAKHLAQAVGEYLLKDWSGLHVYFPRDIARRNARIYDAFTGDNIVDLARTYQLSDTTIYSIIARERERRRIKQLMLLGTLPK